MSELRDNLSAARREYERVHYPGNLAADAFARRHRRQTRAWYFAFAGSAVAAAIALAIFVHLRGATTPEGPGDRDTRIVLTPGTTLPAGSSEQIAFVPESQPLAGAEVPSSPENISFTPVGQSLLPAVPSFWAYQEDEPSDDSTPTTQEAV